MLYPVPDVPQYLRSEGPESVALKERARLGLPVAQQLKWENDREAFLRWRQLIEALGVFVYVTSPDYSRHGVKEVVSVD